MLNLNDNYKDYLGKFLFVLSLLLLGFMIFLIIQKPFLHIDEWFTKGMMTLSFGDMVHITAHDVHPPFYYATVWAPAKILNLLHIPFDKIFVMKMMSVLCYVLLLVISFTKVRKDYGWLTAGLFAFTTIALSNFFTTFSIARMYPLGILLLVCGFIAAGEIIKGGEIKHWVMLTVFAVLGAYTQYFIAFNFAILYLILFLFIILKNRSELRNWISSTVFSIICYIPWTFVLLKQLTSVQGGALSITEITFDTVLASFASVFSTSSDLMPQIISIVILLVLLILVLRQYKESPKENEFILLGFLIFIGTILCAVFVSVIFKPILLVRYLLPAAAVVLLSTSIFISRLDSKKIIIPVVVLILLFGAVNLYGQTNEISKNHEKLVENQEFLKSINNENSVVIITSQVKLIHFYNELNNAIVYEDFTVDKREGARDWAKVLDNKDYKFMIPDDVNYFKNKTIYIAYRDDGHDMGLPSGYSLEPAGRVENCQFSKLVHSSK